MGRLLGACLLVLAGGPRLSLAARADLERAVERARYQFVIGNTKPFDEAYPRSVFQKRVARELVEEGVLQKIFGLSVTPKRLAGEYERIERETRAPEQWEAIKKALGNDRRLIEEIFCRPLLVERALRARFDFDPKIHAVPHQGARQARAAFLAGKKPRQARVQLLRRKPEVAPDTDELLRKAQAETSLPRVLAPKESGEANAAVSVDPEMARVLEKELKKSGDVTTILEERDRFSVFRLIAVTQDSWTVEAVRFPKVDFDEWFEKALEAAR